MSAAAAAIPFERQTDLQTHRGCGAACLRMVYGSLGKQVSQDEIWPAISKKNRFGRVSSTTHLMAKDALDRGFSALAFQAKHPLLSLRRCRDLGIRAILNHRLQADLPTGHYSVLVDIDDRRAVLHDPFYGPARELSPAELLELWQPRFTNSEIIGGVLIAVAEKADEPAPCEFCQTPIPSSITCPGCKSPVSLRPGAVLACVNQECVACTWEYVCCPKCDFMWQSGSQKSVEVPEAPRAVDAGQSAGMAGSQPAAEPAGMTQMFEALEKFVEHAKSVPGLSDNADLQRQLQILTGAKANLRLAMSEAATYAQIHQDRLAAFTQAAKEREEAHRKRVKDLTTPSPPLDGNALGRALLKNLGFPTK